MRALIVTTAYPRFPGDVITPWLTALVQRLKERGIDVRIFTSSFRGLKSHKHNGVTVYRFRYAPAFIEDLTHDETAIDRVKKHPFYIILAIFYLIFGCIAIIRLLLRESFDVLHIQWPVPHIIFGLAGRMVRRFKLISSFHGVEIRWLKRDLDLFFLPFKMMISRSDVITANSTHTRNELRPHFDAEIIPLGVGFMPVQHSTEKDYLLFVGRLVERKGVRYLIKAFASIKDRITDRLVVVGSGSQMIMLKNLVSELGINDRVDFTGFVSDEELAELLAGCKIFCLPAIVDQKGDTEGLGVVLIEALAHKKPVIASNTGGIPDIIVNNLTGILVPPGDSQSLADAMLKLINNRRLRQRLGTEGERYVRRKFSWSRIIDRVVAIYR